MRKQRFYEIVIPFKDTKILRFNLYHTCDEEKALIFDDYESFLKKVNRSKKKKKKRLQEK